MNSCSLWECFTTSRGRSRWRSEPAFDAGTLVNDKTRTTNLKPKYSNKKWQDRMETT